MVCGGSPADSVSSCRCAFFRAYSAASFWKSSWSPSTPAACSFSAHSPISRRAMRSWLVSRRCGRPNGSSTPNAPSAVPSSAYVACYTHRLAISNSRLIALHDNAVAFKWKDYRIEGRERYKTMTLATGEFIRRFLMHVLPSGFHRIRHYGLFASGVRIQNIARAHELLTASVQPDHNSGINDGGKVEPASPSHSCPCCGGRMIVIETFEFGRAPRSFSANEVWIDTS
jgi:hypothetical protein